MTQDIDKLIDEVISTGRVAMDGWKRDSLHQAELDEAHSKARSALRAAFAELEEEVKKYRYRKYPDEMPTTNSVDYLIIEPPAHYPFRAGWNMLTNKFCEVEEGDMRDEELDIETCFWLPIYPLPESDLK
jgi:hypothetical protein